MNCSDNEGYDFLQCIINFSHIHLKNLTNFNGEGTMENLTTEISSKKITIENKRGVNQIHHVQFSHFFQLRFDQTFSLD